MLGEPVEVVFQLVVRNSSRLDVWGLVWRRHDKPSGSMFDAVHVLLLGVAGSQPRLDPSSQSMLTPCVCMTATNASSENWRQSPLNRPSRSWGVIPRLIGARPRSPS